MTSVEVVYEDGVLRPLQPLDLAEGTRLRADLVEVAVPDPQLDGVEERVDEEKYQAFLRALDEIANLPLESAPQPRASEEIDAILYPKQGNMP